MSKINNWKSKRIFITGGGGFLGKEIIRMLKKQTDIGEIISIGRSPQPELIKNGVKAISVDIRDKNKIIELTKGIDFIFHTAAIASMWGSYKKFYDTNVKGTENIIEACQINDIPNLIYTSSPSVVSSNKNIENGSENIPYPTKYFAHYAQSKAIAEEKVLNAGHSNLRTIALRPHLIWGPGDPHILPRLIQKAKQNKLIRIGDKTNKVDLTYITNAAFAHIKAAESLNTSSSISGKAYFISDDSPVILWDWIDDFLLQIGIEKIKKSISLKKAKLLGILFEAVYRILQIHKEPPITRFVAMQLGLSHFFDISAAKNDFGYHPIVDYDVALKQTIEYFAQNQP